MCSILIIMMKIEFNSVVILHHGTLHFYSTYLDKAGCIQRASDLLLIGQKTKLGDLTYQGPCIASTHISTAVQQHWTLCSAVCKCFQQEGLCAKADD